MEVEDYITRRQKKKSARRNFYCFKGHQPRPIQL